MKNNNVMPMWKRIFADSILFLSILFFPWWATVIIALLFVVAFHMYYEFIIAGFFIDALYGATLIPAFGLGSAAAFFLVAAVKKRMRLREL